jgi:hypothetical protein
MTEQAKCPVCGNAFLRDEPWKRVCFPCWRKTKNRTTADSSAEAENRRLRQEAAKLRNEVHTLRSVIAIRAASIPANMLKRLIRLCHPDRHGNSQASTEATQWLLAQRGQQ